MTTETKDIYDAILAGNKSLDGAFRLFTAGKYMTDDLKTKRKISRLLRRVLDVEEAAIDLLMELNNEI